MAKQSIRNEISMNPRLKLLFTALSLAPLAVVHAAEPSSDWEREIETRRGEYLGWIVEHFGKLEPDMKPLDGRAWSLNQARLFLDRDTDKANRYFEKLPVNAPYPPKPEALEWVALRFLPELQTYLFRIRPDADCGLLPESIEQPCWPAFVATVERMHSMALHPRDIAVRAVVAQDIHHSLSLMEAQLASLPNTQQLAIRPLDPGF